MKREYKDEGRERFAFLTIHSNSMLHSLPLFSLVTFYNKCL